MIGHLQTNKTKVVAPVISMVHTIDSAHVANELAKRAAKIGRSIAALIEVNVAKDPSKTGCAPDALGAIIDAVRAAAGALELRGLMTMPPYSDDADAGRVQRFVADYAAHQQSCIPRSQ